MKNTSVLTHRSTARGAVRRLLWALLGALAAVLTVGWILWFAPHALLGPDALHHPMRSSLTPAVYAAGLAACGCFARAAHRPGSRNRPATTPYEGDLR